MKKEDFKVIEPDVDCIPEKITAGKDISDLKEIVLDLGNRLAVLEGMLLP